MRIGARISADRPDQGGIRSALLLTFAAIALVGVTHTSQVHASDRDTPAYLIYVDPITGKYSTKPPDGDNSGSADVSSPPSVPQGPTGSNAILNSSNPTASRGMTGALTAILLLTSAAFISLLLKGKRDA